MVVGAAVTLAELTGTMKMTSGEIKALTGK